MLVTGIRKLDGQKSLVWIDEEPAFALYHGEIRKFGLEEGEELTESRYREILVLLLKRGRERTAWILGKSDRSCEEIRKKLKEGHYPSEVADRIVSEFTGAGYLDDRRYARNYIKYHAATKSRDRICYILAGKGICRETIQEVLESGGQEKDEFLEKQNRMIEREFIRKKYNFEEEDRLVFQKIVASLLRKGFHYGEIMEVYRGLVAQKSGF